MGKVEEIGRKIDELRDFLEDVFLTTEECMLLKEVDDIVKNKRFSELKSLNEIQILIHKRAYEFLKDLKSEEKQRIVDKLKQLEDFPAVRLDIVKIAGETDTFRLRIGNYRALFKVYEQEKIIVIVKIDIRKRIYQ